MPLPKSPVRLLPNMSRGSHLLQGEYGDLLIKFRILFPTSLDEDQKAKIKESLKGAHYE